MSSEPQACPTQGETMEPRSHSIASSLTLRLLPLSLVLLSLALYAHVSGEHGPSRVTLAVDEERRQLGENTLREMERKAGDSPCWKEAISKLNSTCRSLTDIETSRLAVAFANCHLQKSARTTYPCDDGMTIEECTRDMDPVAFQTYTHFFTHTGHICYFLQNEVWQERTENTIGRLSDASSEAVEKLEHSLEYHRQMDKKQNVALRNQEVILDQDQKIAKSLEQTRSEMGEAFDEMSEMAEKQKRLLSEMFSSLQNSVDVVRNLMSLLVVEFVGYETFATFLVAWLVIVFLPHFGYSKLKLHIVLFTDLFLEILVRRIYSFWVFRDGTQAPPDNLSSLHAWLWRCRYACLLWGIVVYLWEWFTYCDYQKRNSKVLEDIRRQNNQIIQALSPSLTQGQRAGQGDRVQPQRSTWPLQANVRPPQIQPDLIPPSPTAAQPLIFVPKSLPTLVTDSYDGTTQPDGAAFGVLRRPEIHHPEAQPRALFEPIQGLPPPVGHPLSDYTTPSLEEFIHKYDLDQPSTHNSDSDSDNESVIFVSCEDPLARQPIGTKASPPRRPAARSTTTPRQQAGRRSSSRARAVAQPSNVPVTQKPAGDESEPEKEVFEEKGSDKGRASLGLARRRRTTSTVSPQRLTRRSIQPKPSPSDTPRYNLRERRTPQPSPYSK